MSFVSEITDAVKLFVEPHIVAIKKDLEGLSSDVKDVVRDQKETQKQVAVISERLARLQAKFEQAEQAALARIQGGTKR